MTMDPTSSTNTQQLLGDAITQLRNDQPATARDLAHRAVDLGLDDATVWGVIALASRNMADYDAAQSPIVHVEDAPPCHATAVQPQSVAPINVVVHHR